MQPINTQTKSSNGGFTLLEIVVAVGIFAVIAAIIFPALLQFLEVRERLEQKHTLIVDLQKTFLFLSNDLRFATSRLSKNEFGEQAKTTLSLNDDGNLLDFTAIYPDVTIGGLNVPRRVLWRIQDGKLQRVQYPVMDPDTDTRTIVQTLLTEVVEAEVEVFFVEEGRDQKSGRWQEQSRLPDMLEIIIELENGQQFNRKLTMQGGDSAAALLAASAPVPGQPAAPGSSTPPGGAAPPAGSTAPPAGSTAPPTP